MGRGVRGLMAARGGYGESMHVEWFSVVGLYVLPRCYDGRVVVVTGGM